MLCAYQSPAQSKIHIDVIYPKEGAIVNAALKDSAFIFGNIRPTNAQLRINGISVAQYPNGAFLGYLPVQPGDFSFRCVVSVGTDSMVVERKVVIPGLPGALPPDSLALEKGSFNLQKDCTMIPGDLFEISFRGTPFCRASFSIAGIGEFPMQERPLRNEGYWAEWVFGQALPSNHATAGLYSGNYLIQTGDQGDSLQVLCKLVNDRADTIYSIAPGRLSIHSLQVPQVVETRFEPTVLRTGPRAAYYYFLPKGIKLWRTGVSGDYIRVRLADHEEAWVENWRVKPLPTGSALPKPMVTVIRAFDQGHKIRIMVYTKERVPFRVQQNPQASEITVYLYGITSDTDFIRYDSGTLWINNVRWRQASKEVFELTIKIDTRQLWGYRANYTQDDHFYIDIKKPPSIASGFKKSPLKNLFILLDPGHSPDSGAVGPMGTVEKDANLALANSLRLALESKGAFVYLTRSGIEGITLPARISLAETLEPDLILSLHHNAIPDGLNPFKNRGSSVYYYHASSRILAEALHKKILANLRLQDFGLYYDDLAMCRITIAPSVLIEPAFLMHPEEEMLINSKKYLQLCSKSIVQGLEDFLKRVKD